MSTPTKRLLSLVLAAGLLAGLVACRPSVEAADPPAKSVRMSPPPEATTTTTTIYEEAAEEIARRHPHAEPALIAEAVHAAVSYGIDPVLYGDLIHVESSWRVEARSPVAYGLAQVTPTVGRMYHPEAAGDLLFDPWLNLHAGAWYLRQLLDRFGGDMLLALRAYNAGPTRVATCGCRVSEGYANRILKEG